MKNGKPGPIKGKFYPLKQSGLYTKPSHLLSKKKSAIKMRRMRKMRGEKLNKDAAAHFLYLEELLGYYRKSGRMMKPMREQW